MTDWREWFKKAMVFLEEARDDVVRERYWLACFHAQQFAELALKAVLVRLVGSYPFTHSLVELLEALEALGYRVDDQVYTIAEALEKHYTRARYPGVGLVVYNRRVADRCIQYAEEIRKLVGKILRGQEKEPQSET